MEKLRFKFFYILIVSSTSASKLIWFNVSKSVQIKNLIFFRRNSRSGLLIWFSLAISLCWLTVYNAYILLLEFSYRVQMVLVLLTFDTEMRKRKLLINTLATFYVFLMKTQVSLKSEKETFMNDYHFLQLTTSTYISKY